jgi:hypothetical protein
MKGVSALRRKPAKSSWVGGLYLAADEQLVQVGKLEDM